MSRRAAYLVAMNCDPSKEEVAAAQNYFAEKTREAEVRPVVSPEMVTALDVVKLIAEVNKPIVKLLTIHDDQLAELSKIVAELRKDLTDRQPEPANYSVTVETVFGYCQRVGIKTDTLTRSSHSNRIRRAIEKSGMEIVPVRRMIKGKGGIPVCHWPTWVLERYFAHEKNRNYGILNRQTIDPIVAPNGFVSTNGAARIS